MLRRLTAQVRVRTAVLLACLGFGVLYGGLAGAVFGGSYSTLISAGFPVRVWGNALDACAVGGVLGAAAGGLVGSLAALLGGRSGWTVTGALGGLAMGWWADPYNVLHFTAFDYHDPWWSTPVLISNLSPALIGGLIGFVVDRAFRRGYSHLPGASTLIATVTAAREKHLGPAARAGVELTPAAAPDGRGWEASPVAESRDA